MQISGGSSGPTYSADGLVVGGLIVPQTKTVVFTQTFSSARAVFIVDEAYQVTAIQYNWAGTPSAGSINAEKLTGSTAPGSGTTMQSVATSCAGGAQQTPISASLTATVSTLQLAVGDRIGLAGNPNAGLTLTMVITLKRI